jgi:hypothetical protein
MNIDAVLRLTGFRELKFRNFPKPLEKKWKTVLAVCYSRRTHLSRGATEYPQPRVERSGTLGGFGFGGLGSQALKGRCNIAAATSPFQG